MSIVKFLDVLYVFVLYGFYCNILSFSCCHRICRRYFITLKEFWSSSSALSRISSILCPYWHTGWTFWHEQAHRQNRKTYLNLPIGTPTADSWLCVLARKNFIGLGLCFCVHFSLINLWIWIWSYEFIASFMRISFRTLKLIWRTWFYLDFLHLQLKYVQNNSESVEWVRATKIN